MYLLSLCFYIYIYIYILWYWQNFRIPLSKAYIVTSKEKDLFFSVMPPQGKNYDNREINQGIFFFFVNYFDLFPVIACL